MSRAKEWALRCRLELSEHKHASFVTLTYSPKELPNTLLKEDLQKFLRAARKQLRKQKREVRFFACGEYGEKFKRPHYHLIMFGIHPTKDRDLIEKAWGRGRTQCVEVNARTINYVAGYTQKKAALAFREPESTVNKDGEFYQRPFIQMSRRPGIGGNARKHVQSWKEFAVMDGVKMPVPRFLHDAWKAQATPDQIAANQLKKKLLANQRLTTLEQLAAQEQINQRKQKLTAARRHLD
jgi:hypothetical protein